eukprot:gene6694-biopygen5473
MDTDFSANEETKRGKEFNELEDSDEDSEIEFICEIKASTADRKVKIESPKKKPKLADSNLAICLETSDEDEYSSCTTCDVDCDTVLGDNKGVEADEQLSDESIEYFQGNKNLPIYSKETPDIKEILQICLTGEIPKAKISTVKPMRVTTTATFVVNQGTLNLPHPYDLEADDISGSYKKKEQTRFYEVNQEAGSITNYAQIHEKKNAGGEVVDGTINERVGSTKWVQRKPNFKNAYAVIRKRAVHKATLEKHNVQFIRYIIYIMSLGEYNNIHRNLRNKKNYTLECSNMILSYYFDSEEEVEVESAQHGNAKNPKTPLFVPVAHSTKQMIQQAVQESSNTAPRMLKDKLVDAQDIETPMSQLVRNSKQVSNYKQNYAQKNCSDGDELLTIMLEVFRGGCNDVCDGSDDDQIFLQEMLIRNGKQANIVAYSKPTLNDVKRFCCGDTELFTVLSIDTTFNVANYHLTQTVYRNLAFLKREDGRHPWFPGPVMAHRNKEMHDYSYFWQACKRGEKELQYLRALGTDEDEAMIKGMLRETSAHTINLLGAEHVRKNVKRKLQQLNFPEKACTRIINDIFGSKNAGLVQCLSGEEFDRKANALKEKWLAIEKAMTKNDPLKFVQYFEKHKEAAIRQKMIKSVREAANEKDDYGQNPIEWLHYMVKNDLDEIGRQEGKTHRDISLAACFEALKKRTARMYSDGMKAIFDQGPYCLSQEYERFFIDYDLWMEMSVEDRRAHIRRFFAYVPKAAPVRLAEPNGKDNAPLASASSSAVEMLTRNTTSTADVSRQIPITVTDLQLPHWAVSKDVMEKIFKDAQMLLNNEDCITDTPSKDPLVKAVSYLLLDGI